MIDFRAQSVRSVELVGTARLGNTFSQKSTMIAFWDAFRMFSLNVQDSSGIEWGSSHP